MSQQTIICVDDERMVLTSLESELRAKYGKDFYLEFAESAADGIEIIEELVEDGEEVIVVLSDYIMPGMKGDEFLKRVHQLSPDTLTILLTGQADVDAVANVVNEAKLYRYVGKPWKTGDLARTVDSAIQCYQQSRELEKKTEELETLNAAYRRFVPNHFVDFLKKDSIVDVQFGDYVEKEMSVLFVNIRSFASAQGNGSPEENFRFINSHFQRMAGVVMEHKGVVDKFIGDSIMALFVKSDDAVRASVHLREMFESSGQNDRKDAVVQIGIGIHSGPLILGTVGTNERIDTTVLSETVNVAARIEDLTRRYGVSTIITRETYVLLEEKEQLGCRKLDFVRVEGKEEADEIFEVFSGDVSNVVEMKKELNSSYQKGLTNYREQNWDDALSCFAQCLDIYPDDSMSQIYQQRCQKYRENPPGTNWDFVEDYRSI